ncbi:radical SAM protein [Clostridium perfringens]|uniref:radical SAM/SPASM domain-containing protein n=2 Tax=Clostridium perfringens TaxID=1502 RepID=UPI00224544CF|nr:radical SAM protein [Clostridium perfringens]EJT6665645.1 radical SAM protein [Clostridium perfringens]MCX0362026.1 radical SAM protein [Clostridium perfringens]MCX0368845.1 radical SAM protein [Clostridium perfringens]MDU2658555.1 radical SAM protein [Clostridium perfringens]MDU4605599.1 radical SAM protein [Clostridium perfringens]
MNLENLEKYYKGFNLLSRKNEIDFESYIFNEMKKNNIEKLDYPILIGIKITDKCNFSCKHCFSNNSKFNEISSNLVDNIINNFLKENHPYKIYLTGGEPFLNKNIFNIIQKLKPYCKIFSIHSNASLITNDLAKKLSNILDKNDYVQVSLDGYNKETFKSTRNCDKFDDVIRGIKNLINNNIKVRINTVVTNKNLNFLERIYDLAIKLDVETISFSPLLDCKKVKEVYLPSDMAILKKFDAILEKYFSSEGKVKIIQDPIAVPWGNPILKNLVKESEFVCPAGKTALEINHDGTIYPCPYMYDNKFNMGNLKNSSLKEIWTNNRWTLLRKNFWSDNSKCINCDSYQKCKSGCLAAAQLSDIEFDPRCEHN